ncbi:MAG: hypothetical protein ACJASQ_003088 [Crocinitomicaceae bacterium]|jgi:hypothetical protein
MKKNLSPKFSSPLTFILIQFNANYSKNGIATRQSSSGRSQLVLIAGLFWSLFSFNNALGQTFHASPDPSKFSSYSGNTGHKNATCVRSNENGLDVVTVGYFNDTTNFGNYHLGVFNILKTSNGSDDIFILERNYESGLNWLRTIGGPGNDQALSVDNASGAIVVVGYFSGTVDFNPDPIAITNKTSVGSTDIFVLCLTPTGTFNWVYTMGSQGKDWANSVSIGIDNNVYVTGTFEQNLFYPLSDVATGVLPSKGGTDAFVAKFDLVTGNVGFVESIGGETNDLGTYVDAYTEDAIYLTGTFTGIADVDPGAGVINLEADITNPNLVGIYNERIDGSGNIVWADKIVGAANYSRSGAISGSPDGVYVIGVAAGMTDVDPGPGSYWINPIGSSNTTGFLIKKDPLTGDLIWVRSINSINNVKLTDVFLNRDSWAGDQIFISGIFNESVALETSGGFFESLSTPSQGSFLTSYDDDGIITNSRALDNSRVVSLCQWDHACPSHSGGWVEFCGSFNNTIDFSDDPTTTLIKTNIGGRDAFTCTWLGGCSPWAKSNEGNLQNIRENVRPEEQSVKLYPNPSDGHLTIAFTSKSSNATFKISNSMGAIVRQGRLNESGIAELNLSDLSSGIYSVTIIDGEHIVFKRLIKE